MPPKVLARNADRTGGVLPVPTAARSTPKQPAARLKLEVRRLPPGLTLTEFEETLGEEWKLNGGKVDWREYRQGKTRAPGSGKVPEQSRCYVHLVNVACVAEFEKRFFEVAFLDKAGTHKNPELKHLQPALGFAPNQRTPLQQAKQRTDNRQGTIDQDPEFIAFLEAETQPLTKPPALEFGGADKENEKREVKKTTPLIEDLRERKANKAKAVQAKAEKAEKDKKDKKVSTAKETAAEKDKEKDAKVPPQQKVEQAAKDAAKVLNKQAANKQQQQAQQAKTASPAKSKKQTNAQSTPKQQGATPVPTGPANPAPQRAPQRQRGNAEGIKKMLQKDLGIKPKANPPASASTSSSTATSQAQGSTASTTQTPTAPKSNAKSTSTQAPPSTGDKSAQTKAYLKHANPSQGMTEMLIQQALSAFGEMNNVTIDPRKGTAIAVFKSNDGLKKALEAKKVTVANGAVEVLEFRDRGAGATGTGGRGGFRGRGGRGGRGGGGATAGSGSATACGAGAAAAAS